jgi:hypothetical protein
MITAEQEWTALHILTQNQCKSAPTLLASKQEKQDDTGLVPGGYMWYLMNKLPGVPLSGLFWKLERPERDQIRKAFKTAFEYDFPSIQVPALRYSVNPTRVVANRSCLGSSRDCLHAGAVKFMGDLEDLLWDKEAQKMYVPWPILHMPGPRCISAFDG